MKTSVSMNFLSESGSKLHVLQTLARFCRGLSPGGAFGVRLACRRFGFESLKRNLLRGTLFLPLALAAVFSTYSTFAQGWATVDDFQYVSGKTAENFGLCVAPNGALFAAGWGIDSLGVSHALIMTSNDGGNTWSAPLDDYVYPVGRGTHYEGGIAADANGNLYVAGHVMVNGANGLAARWFVRRSSDNGLTWSTVDDFSAGNFLNWPHAIAADAAGNIYVVGGYGEWVVRKCINGTSWSTVDDFGPSSGALGVLVHPTGGVFVAGDSLITSGKSSFQAWTVRRSLDGGATWSNADTFQLGNTSVGRGLGADTQGNLYVVGNAFETIKGKTRSHWIVRRSSNGGNGTWATVDDFQPNSGGRGVAYGFVADSFGNLFAAGLGATSNTGVAQWIVRRSLGGVGSWVTADNFQFVSGMDAIPSAITANVSGDVFVGGYGNDASGVPHWLVRRQ